MGLLGYLKALLGLGAGPAAVRCRDCGGGVPERDLARGLAVVLARRAFCRRCVAERTSGRRGRAGLSSGLLDSTSRVSL